MGNEYTLEEHTEALIKATDTAKIKNEARKNIFCPMVNHECISLCECYRKTTIINEEFHPENSPGEREPYCTGGFCTCYSLHGPTE